MRHRPLTSSFTMWSILLFLGSILMGGGVFAVTQAAKQHETGIEDINRTILAERQSIRVLEAEWAYLSRPQRLEELMAMKDESAVIPPTPAPITNDIPAQETLAQIPAAVDQAISDTQPAAGTEVAAEEKKEEPSKVAAVATPAPKEMPVEKPKAKKETVKAPAKTAQAKPKAAPVKAVKTAQNDDMVWSIAKKAPTYKAPAYKAPSHNAAYRPVSVSRGGMRPIVE